MDTRASQIQARYAHTILRVARNADPAVAIRLMESLTSDPPARGVSDEQARLHNAAIGDFLALLRALREGSATPPWTEAMAATDRWLART